MRPAALVGLAALLAVSSARAADPTPYCAVVSDVEVKLRAGPGDGFPDTGTLPKGSYVIVEREENGGWLAVTAPYGSVSWIATQFIEDPAPDRLTPKNVIVHVDDEVTLATGKVGEAQPLDIRRVKVPNGTRLVLLGPKVTFAGKTWYPVSPPAGDVRYLPKTAVRYDKPAPNNFSVRVIENTSPPPGAASPAAPATPAGGPLATVPGPGSTPAPAGGVVASKPAVNHPLWTQAETAEREGRFADAEKAYFDLAALMNGQGGDHDIANLCYTRIHALREKKRNARGPAASGTSGRPSVLQPPSKDERGVRAGAPQALPPVTPTNSNTGTSPPAANGGKWTGPGTLRRSVLTPDGTGKPAYALEVAPGVVKAYVVAGPGVELDKLIGQRVDVYGVSKTISGLSKPFIVATAVEQVQ